VPTRKVPQAAAYRACLAPGDGLNIAWDKSLSVDATRGIQARGGDGIERPAFKGFAMGVSKQPLRIVPDVAREF
jgi:hypothetical protein